jgi:hypothetical protein
MPPATTAVQAAAVAALQHGIGQRGEVDVGAAAGAIDDRLDAVRQGEADRARREIAPPASADAGATGVPRGGAGTRAAVGVRRQPGQRRRVVPLRLRRRLVVARQAEPGEVGADRPGDVAPGTPGVDVLDPEAQASATLAAESATRGADVPLGDA